MPHLKNLLKNVEMDTQVNLFSLEEVCSYWKLCLEYKDASMSRC